MSNQPNHSKPTSGLQKPLFVFAIIIIICLLAALAWLVLPANQKTTKATTKATANPAASQPTKSNQTQGMTSQMPPATPQIQEAGTQQHTLNNKATVQTAPKPANQPAHEINPNTGLPYHKNDPAILQKRREVMTQLADIMDNTSKGRKADAQTLQNLVSEIKNIEKLGYFSPEDATNTIAFIQKAYPNLDIVK